MASASTRQDQKQDLQSLLECSICLEIFDEPRTLPCLHSFCKKCLGNFVNGKLNDDLNCPVCRTKFTISKEGVSGMTRNHFICNMVEVMSIQQQHKSIPCSHCQEPSVGRCVTCELFMCEKCFKPHSEYPGFQDHVVLTMEELSKPENQSKIKKSSKCSQHPKKKLKYYCETCDQLICRHCMDFDHDKQHKFSPLEQAANNKRDDLKKTCETLERSVENKNREMQNLKEVCESLNSNFTSAQELINERKDQLLGRLQRKSNSMIEDTRQVFDRKTRNVEEEINKVETSVNRVKASADMARSLFQNGNDEEIVRSYQSVQESVVNENEKIHSNVYDDDVLHWRPDEIDTMLLKEIKDEPATKIREDKLQSWLGEEDDIWGKTKVPMTKFGTRSSVVKPLKQQAEGCGASKPKRPGQEVSPQPAVSRKTKPQNLEDKGAGRPRVSRETKPKAEAPESPPPDGKPQDDHQHGPRDHHGDEDRRQGNQASGSSNENRSPNIGSPPSRGTTPYDPTQALGGGTQGNVSQSIYSHRSQVSQYSHSDTSPPGGITQRNIQSSQPTSHTSQATAWGQGRQGNMPRSTPLAVAQHSSQAVWIPFDELSREGFFGGHFAPFDTNK